jgi:lysylphosphatidylglycerol synthetase-like protein (DUF2156 family)
MGGPVLSSSFHRTWPRAADKSARGPEMGVVMMLLPFRTVYPRSPREVRVSRWATRWAWIITVLDGMTIAWMLTVGSWLDKQHNLLAMATWDGHHQAIVIGVSCALAVLAVIAPLTRGFSAGSSVLFAVVVAACLVSIVAMAGLLALALPAVALVLALALGA